MNEIEEIDKKLQELRKEYKTASKAKQGFIVAGVKLLKEKREKLIKAKEEKEAIDKQTHIL